MPNDKKGMIKIAAFLMVICGILTMFLAFRTLSRVNKTNDNMVKFESYYQTNIKNNNGTDASTSLVFQQFKSWEKASVAYDYMQIALSGLHIVLGVLTLVLAAKSNNTTIFMVFGAILLLMAGLLVVFPLIKHKDAYDDLEAGLEAVGKIIKMFGGSQVAELPFEFDFEMPTLKPWTYVITYSGLGLGFMYMSTVITSGFDGHKPPIKQNNSLAMTGMTGPSDDFFAQFNKPPVPPQAPKAPAPQPKQAAAVTPPPQGQPRPQGAPMQGQPRPQGAPMQGQPRPQGAPMQGQPRPQGAPMQGQPRPQGAPMQGQPRPQGAPMQGQPRPQGAPMQGQPRPQGAPMQGQPRPQGAPMQGQPRPQGAPMQGQPRPQGAPMQGQPRPQGAPMQGQPRPQGAPMQGQPRPQVRPAPNVRPAPGVKPKPPVDDDGPMSSGSMDEVALPSAEDLERLLGGMSGQK